jgi:hypothetical protein
MTARRDFLKGAAASGIFFCGCALLRAAQAQSSTARARRSRSTASASRPSMSTRTVISMRPSI